MKNLIMLILALLALLFMPHASVSYEEAAPMTPDSYVEMFP